MRGEGLEFRIFERPIDFKGLGFGTTLGKFRVCSNIILDIGDLRVQVNSFSFKNNNAIM